MLKASILGSTVRHPSAEVSYLLFVDWIGIGRGGGETVVFGFLSRQLGEWEQPDNTGADEMDEIEAGVKSQLKREGEEGGTGFQGPIEKPQGQLHWSRDVSFKVLISPIWLIFTLPDWYLSSDVFWF